MKFPFFFESSLGAQCLSSFGQLTPILYCTTTNLHHAVFHQRLQDQHVNAEEKLGSAGGWMSDPENIILKFCFISLKNNYCSQNLKVG